MSKLITSEQIKTLRRAKGLSQESLAENAQINLRTLQRIESGATIPRGETLRLLAQALDVPVESLTPALAEDTAMLKLLNLSALAFWLFPLGNILVPLGIWIAKRNEVAGVRELGKRILNFQITWSILTYGFAFAIMMGLMSGRFILHPFVMVGVMFLMLIFNTAVILVTHAKIVRGEADVYGMGLKIIS